MELSTAVKFGAERLRATARRLANYVLLSDGRDELVHLGSEVDAIARERMRDAYDGECMDPDRLFSETRATVASELGVLRDVVVSGKDTAGDQARSQGVECDQRYVPTADLVQRDQLERAHALWHEGVVPGAESPIEVIDRMIAVEAQHKHSMSVENAWRLRIERAGYFDGDATFTITEDMVSRLEPEHLSSKSFPNPTPHDAYLIATPPYYLYQRYLQWSAESPEGMSDA